MSVFQTSIHPEVTVQPEGVVQFLQATLYYHWKRRPRDMSYTDMRNIKHPGVALNYLRTQMGVEREYMARLLFMGTNNYTQLELRGSPLRLHMTEQLTQLCASRGLVNLGRYFASYLGIKERNTARRNRL